MKMHRTLTALCSAAALSFAVAACGDDDEATGGGSGTSTNATAPAAERPAGDPIRIGVVCTCSGPQGSANGPSKEVAEAWEAATNEAGGLNGHPVEIVFKDDGGDPAKAATAVRELVEEEKVMAIAGQNSLADAAFQKYVEQKEFPIVGGIPYNPASFTSPMFFPSGANLLAEFHGMIAAAKAEGITKIGAFYCAEAATCAQVAPLMGALGEKVVGGVKLVNSAKVAATAPNYTAQCLAAKEADVEGLFIAASPAISTRIYEQCQQQGFSPKFIGINGALPVKAAENDTYDGAIISQGNLPPTNTQAPGGKALAEALEKHASGLTDDTNWNANPTHTWAGLQLFAKAAESGELTPQSTPDDVKTALYGLKDETLDGLTGPLNFTEGQPTFNVCPFIEKVESGQWVSPDGAEPACLAPEQVEAVVAIAQAAAG